MTQAADRQQRQDISILVAIIFIAGLCSIVYELLIATTAAYFLGDSITQFSLTIGIYMAAMGLGSFLSRFLSNQGLVEKFVIAEICLGFIGGASVPILYYSFAYTDLFSLMTLSLTLSIGILIGLEIPLLSRLMENYYVLRQNISNVLSLDYFGALVATLVFPFLLLPFIGVFKSSLFFGMVNMLIGYLMLWRFGHLMSPDNRRRILIGLISASLILVSFVIFSSQLLAHWSNNVYEDRIIYQRETRYQNIVMTKDKNDLRLYLNGHLQFASSDEYRYHEALIHVPAGFAKHKHRALILGGGDGLALRELLKYPQIEQIQLVDLDPAITELGQQHPQLRRLNNASLDSPRVQLFNQDALVFLQNQRQDPSKQFDLIYIDLPDPNNTSLARLYSREFYRLVKQNLRPSGLFVTQATSPFFATQAFWSIVASIKAAGFADVRPYHLNVPAFGEWGFVVGSQVPLANLPAAPPVDTKFLNPAVLPKLFVFAKDLQAEAAISSLDDPRVLAYYLKGWRTWN